MSRLLTFLSRCSVFLGPNKGLFTLFVVASVLAVLFEGIGISMIVPLLQSMSSENSFSGAYVLGHITSYFQDYTARDRILISAGVIAFFLVLTGISKILVAGLNTAISLRIRQRLTLSMYEKVVRSNIEFLNSFDRGKLINAMITIPAEIAGVIKATGEIIYGSLLLTIYTSLMLLISFKMTLAVLCALGISALLINYTTHFYIRRAGKGKVEALSGMHHIAHESMNGIKLIKSLAIENDMFERLKAAASRFSKNQYTALVLSEVPRPALITFAGLLICSILVYNAYSAPVNDTSWLSPVFMFIIVLFRLTGPFSSINVSLNTVTSYLHSMETYEQVLEQARQNQEKGAGGLVPQFEKEIRVENLCFKYSQKKTNSLDDLSLRIPKNSVIALVGPSGAGKTTLAALFCRFYENYEGAIYIDGSELRNIDSTLWRRKVSFVMQDTFIFDDTLRNNLKIACPQASDDEILDIARKVDAYDFIQNMPEGLETRLGDKGVKLSGGQRQRISLMRSLLEGAEFIILDEATSQLDSLTEHVIQKTVESLRDQVTILIIAHRLSTTKNADQIIVMNEGKIVEQGTHKDLIANDTGLYVDLVKHQNVS